MLGWMNADSLKRILYGQTAAYEWWDLAEREPLGMPQNLGNAEQNRNHGTALERDGGPFMGTRLTPNAGIPPV